MTPARKLLGAELKKVREAAGRTTRQVEGYTSGHISNVENGRVLPSDGLVRAYTAMGGRYAYLSALLSKARGEGRSPNVRGDPDLANALRDPRTDPYVLRQGYIVESVEDSYYIGAFREPVMNIHRVSLRAAVPGAHFFPFRHSYEEDPRPGVSTVSPLSGCTVALIEESSNGTVYGVLEFDPSSDDELGRYNLSWVINLSTAVPVRTRIVSGTRSRIPQAVQRLQFAKPAVPDRLWSFREFDLQVAGMDPQPDNVMALNDTHLYVHEVINPQEEWWGMAWSWAS